MLKDQWFKSSFSSGNTDNCIEAYFDGETVSIRDTKDRDGGTLAFTHKEWAAFVAGVRNNEFEL